MIVIISLIIFLPDKEGQRKTTGDPVMAAVRLAAGCRLCTEVWEVNRDAILELAVRPTFFKNGCCLLLKKREKRRDEKSRNQA